jgi:hypothetical protein
VSKEVKQTFPSVLSLALFSSEDHLGFRPSFCFFVPVLVPFNSPILIWPCAGLTCHAARSRSRPVAAVENIPCD